MEAAFGIIFALIWMFAVITIIVKVASGASRTARMQQQTQRAQPQQQQFRMPPQNSQSFRSVPGATYGSSNTGSRSAYSGSRPAPADVKTQSVLFEDRRNDWLAQQFREEAALKRRAGNDLGASHEVECAADDLKRSHIRRHNTTGLNQNTFR